MCTAAINRMCAKIYSIIGTIHFPTMENVMFGMLANFYTGKFNFVDKNSFVKIGKLVNLSFLYSSQKFTVWQITIFSEKSANRTENGSGNFYHFDFI